MASSSKVPKFASFDGQLTIAEAAKHRNALLEEMDALAISATKFANKPAIFQGLRDVSKDAQALSITFNLITEDQHC